MNDFQGRESGNSRDFNSQKKEGFKRFNKRRGGGKNFGKSNDHDKDCPKIEAESVETINDFVFPAEFEFQNFNLSKAILFSIFKLGFLNPTEIQKEILLSLDDDRDIMAQSSTGSGKTLAFATIILNDIIAGKRKKSLILAPTREIAFQIFELFVKLIGPIKRMHNIDSTVVVGGVPIDRQIDRLKRNPQIVIGTPGRVIDLLDRNKLDLSEFDIITLDEFDRMLDMGFRDEVRRIVKDCSKDSKNLMFSATIGDKVKKDASEYLKNPKTIIIGKKDDGSLSSRIRQIFKYSQNYDHKIRILLEIVTGCMAQNPDTTILIFVNTKHETEKVVDILCAENHKADFIHGDLPQRRRQNVVQNFKTGTRNILVATDLFARGVDISGLGVVVQFDPAKTAEEYNHRAGRTGRGNEEGDCISIIGPRDGAYICELKKTFNLPIECPDINNLMQSSSRGGSSGGFGRRGGSGRFNSGGRFGGGFGRSSGKDSDSTRSSSGSFEGRRDGDRGASFGGGFGSREGSPRSFGDGERRGSFGGGSSFGGGFRRESSFSKGGFAGKPSNRGGDRTRPSSGSFDGRKRDGERGSSFGNRSFEFRDRDKN